MLDRSPEPVASSPALETLDLHAWCSNRHVLKGVNLRITAGQVAVLLGRPGSGHDELSRAVLGLTPSRKGSVRIHGTESIAQPADKIKHLGIGHCSAGTGVFAGLSCEENLLLPSDTADALGGGMSLAEIYELLPVLYPRRHMPCTRLSGGEQQMLAIARILRTGANLILLDNVVDGLAPVMVHGMAHLIQQLRHRGYTLLLIEQNLEFAAPLADCLFVMHEGRVTDQLDPSSASLHQDAFHALFDNH